MPVNEPLSYEASVFVEDITAIAQVIVDDVVARIGPIGGEKMKSCLVAAALMSAAETLDGELYKDLGVTGALARLVASRVLKR